jgi:hypothetical protein
MTSSPGLTVQRGVALSDEVAVGAASERGLGGGFDGPGHIEMRLADAQVDRVFETLGQLEYLANSRSLDVPHPVGNPAIRT